jgi:hypothetical protein
MMSNESTISAPSFDTVRPRAENSPTERSKKATRIAIGGKTQYPYETAAVMGNRGHDEPEHGKRDSLIYSTHARPLSGRDVRISETAKLGSYGNTSSSGNIG